MPRLSLYKPEKGNDFKFIDKNILEQFQVGGTDVFVHKYIGPVDPTDPNKALGETSVQDILFGENRDRKYDTTVYVMRGVYNVQDIDFNLSQFGLFLQNDTVFMTIHINYSVETLGRKIMSGDVFELPHLKEYYNLSNAPYALRKFYVVEDINRAAEGFSVTWYPHLYRVKLKPMPDSQEFKDITNTPVNEDKFAGDWKCETTYYPGQIIRFNGILYEVTKQANCINAPNSEYYRPLNKDEILAGSGSSDYELTLLANQAIVAEAEADSPLSGYDTRQFYTLQKDEKGNVALRTVDQSDIYINDQDHADEFYVPPVKDGYVGYLTGDGLPPNGLPYGFGIQFPDNAATGDYFLRVDYLPNRLFRYDGGRWILYETKVRTNITNTDTRDTQKTTFINNNNLSGVGMLQTDTFYAEDPKVFRPDDPTLSFNLVDKKFVTKQLYDAKYAVEVWVNESRNPVTSTFNEGGKLGFYVKLDMKVGDTIRWTIYQVAVQQRQSLSKALRPRADF